MQFNNVPPQSVKKSFDRVTVEHVEQRAMSLFLGVHRFAPILGIQDNMGWTSCNIRWAMNI